MSFLFLCIFPFLAAALMARPLRVPGLYQTIGAVHFAIACFAAWNLGAKVMRAGTDQRRKLALAGTLLFVPFALVSLLWVGLGPPWIATPTENRMRYLVLLVSAMAVSIGFVVLKEALIETGERIYSTLAAATTIFAGAAFMIWLTIHVAFYSLAVRDGEVRTEIISLVNMSDVLLFVACVLTYLSTAAFAASMGRAEWLGKGAAYAYVGASLVALGCIVMRGLSFPDPAGGAMPWYTQPGFIAGIPAVPWIMPFLLGIVILRRAGKESSSATAASVVIQE